MVFVLLAVNLRNLLVVAVRYTTASIVFNLWLSTGGNKKRVYESNEREKTAKVVFQKCLKCFFRMMSHAFDDFTSKNLCFMAILRPASSWTSDYRNIFTKSSREALKQKNTIVFQAQRYGVLILLKQSSIYKLINPLKHW